MSHILLLHGPNLNLLGIREPQIYGHTTLEEINKNAVKAGKIAGISIQTAQSNSESELIDILQQAPQQNISFIIFNPAAYTHTSIALRDTLTAIQIPFIEIHLSNTKTRETFRHQSYFTDIAHGLISGFGAYGYQLATQAAIDHLQSLKQ